MGSPRGFAGAGLVLALLAPPALADSPRLVIDAATDLSEAPGSQPRAFVSVGAAAVFVAVGDDGAERLWRSDGTLDGTFAIGPVCPSSAGSQAWEPVGALPGLALYSFYCEASGTAVWRTDGSSAGTFELFDYSDSYVVPVAVSFDGRLVLLERPTADAVVDRLRLWTTDGTLSGTRRGVDRELGGWATLGDPVAATDRVEVVAWMEVGGGPVVWRSGGDEASTRVVAVLAESLRIYGGLEAIAFGRFVAYRNAGSQLWVSDGTAAGTAAVTAFADPGPAFLFGLWDADGERLLFVADDGAGENVWESDGTAAGTRALTRFAEPTGLQFFGGPHTFVALGGRVVFYANDLLGISRLLGLDRVSGEVSVLAEPCGDTDPDSSCRHFGLWLERLGERAVFPVPAADRGAIAATDGTATGTVELAQLCPAGCDVAPRSPTLAAGELFVAAGPAPGAVELWSFELAGNPTRRGGARDLLALYDGPLDLAPAGDLVLLGATDGRHGFEPYRAVPGGADLELVKDLAYDAASSRVEVGVELQGELYLALDGRVFRTDGSREGTRELIEPPASSCGMRDPGATADLRPLGNRLLIANGDCEEGNLWSYDPATGGLATLLGAARPDRPAFLRLQETAGGETDLLAGAWEAGALELWSTDGSEAGTGPLVTMPGDSASVSRLGDLRYVSVSGGALYLWQPGEPAARPAGASPYQWFRRFGEAGGLGLFEARFDASDAVALVAVAADGSVETLADFGEGGWLRSRQTLGDRQLLRVDRGSDGAPELWVTDGSAGGTARLHSSAPTTQNRDAARAFVAVGGRYAFVSFSAAGETELWTTDGTASGTRLVDRLTAAGETTEVAALAATADRLFVLGQPVVPGGLPDEGRAWLWASPDSPGAAALLAQWPLDFLALTRLWSGAFALRPWGGRVYFAGATPASGTELWSSDGTPEGTGRVADLSPGPTSSYPGMFMSAGDRLYFAPNDGLTGQELWSYAPGDAALCRATPTSLCLQGGRFRVEAGWMDFVGVQGEATAVPLTEESGAFWFFDPANVELVAKVLDGVELFGHHWVFYGALSNVRYALTVRDGLTGAAMRYVNPAGTYASVGDSAAFGPLGASATSAPPPREEPASGAGSTRVTAGPASGACVPGPTRLCLRDGRFAVDASWRDFQGHEGVGNATPWAGGESGTFWFFDAANVELIVKVLDGTPINGRWWVYYGALSNVEYTVTVTDTLTGVVRTYFNPAGTFASVGDVDAF